MEVRILATASLRHSEEMNCGPLWIKTHWDLFICGRHGQKVSIMSFQIEHNVSIKCTKAFP